jgi:hypothetical protein
MWEYAIGLDIIFTFLDIHVSHFSDALYEIRILYIKVLAIFQDARVIVENIHFSFFIHDNAGAITLEIAVLPKSLFDRIEHLRRPKDMGVSLGGL